MSAHGDGRWRRRDDVLWRRSLDAVVLLPAGATDPVTIVDTGAAVWDLLERPLPFGDLVDQLVVAYNADGDVVARDVRALLDELEALGAVGRV